MSKPKILSVESVSSQSNFTSERVHLRFSNGEERHFERLKNRHAVMIVPILNDDTLLLVREYGVGLEDYHLSLPKGGIESLENPEDSANRELKEEVGYGANKLTSMRVLSSSPSYSCSKMHVILAEDLYPCRLEGDEPEPIEVVPWPLKNLPALLEHEDFHEARALAALMLLAKDKGIW